VISTKFFPADNPTAAFLATLATFGRFRSAPFELFLRAIRRFNWKKIHHGYFTFNGWSNLLNRLYSSYETIGFMAPVLVLILRMLQGLALGGEYGGAATYVAEHAP
jgi:MFS family permease